MPTIIIDGSTVIHKEPFAHDVSAAIAHYLNATLHIPLGMACIEITKRMEITDVLEYAPVGEAWTFYNVRPALQRATKKGVIKPDSILEAVRVFDDDVYLVFTK